MFRLTSFAGLCIAAKVRANTKLVSAKPINRVDEAAEYTGPRKFRVKTKERSELHSTPRGWRGVHTAGNG